MQGCVPRAERTVLSEYLPASASRKQPPSKQSPHNFAVYFVRTGTAGSELVKREKSSGNGLLDNLERSLQLLLQGPAADEVAAGLGSEIPAGTVLIGVKREKDKVTIDLSRRFAAGGGIESFETRLAQVRKTVEASGEALPVFLAVEGKLLTITEGEGIEVKQPINRD